MPQHFVVFEALVLSWVDFDNLKKLLLKPTAESL